MLIPVQLIAIFQGIFLLVILLKRHEVYEKVSYRLFFLTILSVLLFLIGDDDNSLLFEERDLFLFDSSLFITFLVLFTKYHESAIKFNRTDLLFFIPNIIYFCLEFYEIFFIEENLIVENLEILVTLIFLSYLVYSIYLTRVLNKPTYFYYFIIPLTIFQGISLFSELFQFDESDLFSSNNLNTVLLLITAFLFYFFTFLLLNNSERRPILKIKPKKKYTSSKLSNKDLVIYKKQIEYFLIDKSIYLDKDLDLQKMANELNITKTLLSEIINKGFNKTFNELINYHRVKRFEKMLLEPEYKNYSILGIAEEAGFNSKTTFNNAFKKVNGITPSKFKKSIENKS